jgi:pyridoxamine 5'-phosphate oxidase
MAVGEGRLEYGRSELTESALDRDPIVQFRRWFGEAEAAGVGEPNAMVLATATPDGSPSARVVLLKEVDDRGFVSFTDYRSRKGREMAANPRAALTFFWQPVERQVRIEGSVARIGRDESDRYFRSRPIGARLGAWTSIQSSVLPDRDTLEAAYRATATRFDGADVPVPPDWGGLRVVPESVEFWQGRASRLHDRLRYHRSGDGWVVERLSP